jgi:hypothetical protein
LIQTKKHRVLFIEIDELKFATKMIKGKEEFSEHATDMN